MRPIRYFAMLAVLAVLAASCGDTTTSTTTTTPPATVPPLATGCAVGAANDLSVEVTQAIQTASNSVQLIAQRSSAVRVTAPAGTLAAGTTFTGTLRVEVNGAEITPAGGVAPINGPVTVAAVPDRNDPNDTLNFELPAPTGIGASSGVNVCVDLTASDGTTAVAAASNLDFEVAASPSLFYTRVDYDGLGLASVADVQPGVGDAFVQGIYPFDDSDTTVYQESPAPTLTFDNDQGTPQFVDTGVDVSPLLAALGTARQTIVTNGGGADNSTFLYGWLPGNPIGGNGWASVGGRVAFGNTDLTRSQRTYAHELGHNFGLDHNSRTLAPNVGWDTGARLDGNPAGNNTTGRVKTDSRNDIMRGGQLTNTAWVDVETYEFFLGSDVFAVAPDAGDVAGDEPAFGTRVAVVQGIMTPDGSGLLRLDPVLRFPWRSQPTVTPRQAPFLAIVETESGEEIRVPFDARIAGDSDEDGFETFGYFEVMIPVDPAVEIAALTIADAGEDVVFGGFEPSEPPEAFIEVPQQGAQLGRRFEMFFGAFDADTPPEELRIQVLFSPDGGESWVPVAVNLSGTQDQLVVDATRLPSAIRTGVLQLVVSDGLNTITVSVPELTTR